MTLLQVQPVRDSPGPSCGCPVVCQLQTSVQTHHRLLHTQSEFGTVTCTAAVCCKVAFARSFVAVNFLRNGITERTFD